VRGTALKLDGFRTHVRSERSIALGPSDAFTVEGWIALASYPWSWAPLVDDSDPGVRGFSLGIDPEGRVGFELAAGDSWFRAASDPVVPLRRWTHVAAVFEPDRRISVLVDGQEVATAPIRGDHVPARDGSLTLGRSHVPQTWNEPQLTSEDMLFFLDGLLDEVRITRAAKGADEIRREVAEAGEPPEPALSDRSRLPTGPVGSGSFGAFHTRLDYYPEWDAL